MPLFSASSPFDSEVEQATSELNVKEDLMVMRDLCQRCQHSANGAKDLLRSIVKRLSNKIPHVAMQALTLLDVGVVYGGLSFRQEIASRDFVSECRTLITNGKTHTKVIKRLKHLIRRWAENEFKSDSSLSLIPSLFNSLRSEGHSFPVDDQAVQVPPSQEDDDLARAIALSLKEAGGKSGKSIYPSMDGVGSALGISKAMRQVRALYDFEAAEDNELTFKAGELLYILDDSDTNWWKGSSHRGEGLFPANFVTADLTAEAEPEISQTKSRKSVRFHDEVDVQVVDVSSPEAVQIDERKIDEALALIQNADPTQEVENDAPELSFIEDQCRAMGPHIDQELEKIDRQHNMMVQLNGQLLDAFKMYHALMQHVPTYSTSAVPSYQSVECPPSVPVAQLAPIAPVAAMASAASVSQPNFPQLSALPTFMPMTTGFALPASLSQSYQPSVLRTDSPQHMFTAAGGTSIVGTPNVL